MSHIINNKISYYNFHAFIIVSFIFDWVGYHFSHYNVLLCRQFGRWRTDFESVRLRKQVAKDKPGLSLIAVLFHTIKSQILISPKPSLL